LPVDLDRVPLVGRSLRSHTSEWVEGMIGISCHRKETVEEIEYIYQNPFDEDWLNE